MVDIKSLKHLSDYNNYNKMNFYRFKGSSSKLHSLDKHTSKKATWCKTLGEFTNRFM